MFCCAAVDEQASESVAVKEEPKAKEEVPIFATPAPKEEEAKEVDGGLTFTFAEGEASKEITFTKGPQLGFTFKDIAPLVVTKLTAGGHAEALGVKVGMKVTKIGSTDVTDKKYGEILQLLKDSAAKLPSA